MQVQPQDAQPNILFARYYSNQTARFLSVDPSRASATTSQPQSWNRFGYARNNPVNRIDPDGLKDEYAKFRSTKQAIVDAYRRFHAQTGTPAEMGTAAYETKNGATKLIAGKAGKHIDSVKSAGPLSPAGAAELAAGSQFRGEAHVHPDEDGPISIADQNVWRENNLAIGIEPMDNPEAAVDGYVVTPSGRVLQIAYGSVGTEVTTVGALEEELKADTDQSEQPGEESTQTEEPGS